MASADGKVLPKPGIPKTLGILNVIFGVLLVLMGLCTVGGLAAAPLMLNAAEKIGKQAQAKVEEQRQATIKTYDDQIAAAKTDEEKKAIEQQKADYVATEPPINPIDMSAATDVFKDPTIMIVTYAGALSGLLLHIVLLIAGIGLIRLTPWGRSLSIWWGWLQIVQVIVLLAANVLYVIPVTQVNNAKQIAKVEAAANAKGGQGAAGVVQMTKISAAMTLPMTVASSLLGVVYPIILVIMLSNAGARAACLAKKPLDIDDL